LTVTVSVTRLTRRPMRTTYSSSPSSAPGVASVDTEADMDMVTVVHAGAMVAATIEGAKGRRDVINHKNLHVIVEALSHVDVDRIH